MSSLKHSRAGGILVKNESTYATDAAPAATDAIRFSAFPEVTLRYPFDGARELANGSFGSILRTAPVARDATWAIKCEGKGRGAAYTSSAVEVPDVHRLLKACGLDATVTTTGGSEKWDYTPTATTAVPGSATIWGYTHGELIKTVGAYGNLKINGKGVGIPEWDFSLAAIASTAVPITDLALPALTYTVPTVVPASATGITLVLGNFTGAIVRSFEFDLGRTFDNRRLNLNSAIGHAGFTPGPRNPSLKLRVEATTLQGSPFHAAAAIDPYQLVSSGTSGLACSLQVGSTQYNRWKLVFGQVQVVEAVGVEEGEAFCWDLTVEPYITGDQDNSDVTIRFD